MVVYGLFQFDEEDEIDGMSCLEGLFETREKAREYAIDLLKARLEERMGDVSPAKKAKIKDFGEIYESGVGWDDTGLDTEIGINGHSLYFILTGIDVK